MLKLLEALRLYADLLRDAADALANPQCSSAGADLAANGCGPVRVRIASPAAAMNRAEGEQEVLICGECVSKKALGDLRRTLALVSIGVDASTQRLRDLTKNN